MTTKVGDGVEAACCTTCLPSLRRCLERHRRPTSMHSSSAEPTAAATTMPTIAPLLRELPPDEEAPLPPTGDETSDEQLAPSATLVVALQGMSTTKLCPAGTTAVDSGPVIPKAERAEARVLACVAAAVELSTYSVTVAV